MTLCLALEYQSIFTALKVLCVLPIHLSLLLNPWHHRAIHYLQNFALSRWPYSWNHVKQPFQADFFYSLIPI